jgi:hypothetical protein
MTKKLIILFLFVGSTLGGYLPLLWGESSLSLSSVLLSALGGFLGIYVGYALGKHFE